MRNFGVRQGSAHGWLSPHKRANDHPGNNSYAQDSNDPSEGCYIVIHAFLYLTWDTCSPSKLYTGSTPEVLSIKHRFWRRIETGGFAYSLALTVRRIGVI